MEDELATLREKNQALENALLMAKMTSELTLDTTSIQIHEDTSDRVRYVEVVEIERRRRKDLRHEHAEAQRLEASNY